MMKSEPVEEEIPVGREDLSLDTQVIFSFYDILPSKWESFSGGYLGKDLSLLPILFEEYEVQKDMRRYAWTIIPIIDSFVAEDIAKKIKSKSGGKPKSGS